MEKIKLKPCPFCGSPARLEDAGWPHHVYCLKCGANVKSVLFEEEGENEAIAAGGSEQHGRG